MEEAKCTDCWIAWNEHISSILEGQSCSERTNSSLVCWALGSTHTCIHVNSFKETRQSKQLHPKTTPFFPERKNELPWAGFEPAPFCVLGERSTN